MTNCKNRLYQAKGLIKFLLIDISGALTTSKDSGIFSEPSHPARLKEFLTKAEKDKQVKAIVLRINTPGGTVTSSDILYHELEEFKQERKIPVIASIMDVGASGGYYVAMASDAIYAHPSTITGSIGVIMVTGQRRGPIRKNWCSAFSHCVGSQKIYGIAISVHEG